MKRFTADFETATWLEDETYVWAWATCEIGNEENLVINNNIDKFMKYVEENKNSYWYFHNLKFDGEFIIYWLEKNNFKYIKDKKEAESGTYSTLISDMGLFYQITIWFKINGKKVVKATFFDSLKIINLRVEQVPKAFGLNINKLDLDYNTPRSRYHVIKEHEKEYIKNDVLIMAQALDYMFKHDLKKMTQGSNAVYDYKKGMSESSFNYFFPQLDKEVDKSLRQCYRGGFTYLSSDYVEKDVGKGVVLDVNSLYPSCMYDKYLPIGEGILYEGQYQKDNIYDLYIQYITCNFKIKKNKIPTIQIKNSANFIANEYLTESGIEPVVLCLTSVDLKLFLEQYDVTNLDYNYGWKFKSHNGLFKDYIDKWIEIKNKATIEKNEGMRTIAKLMLNSLYGKLATTLETASKIPYLGEDEIVHYTTTEKEEKNGMYLPAGAFITAYAREKTIRTSQAIMDYSINKYGKNKYVYSDTDSIHCLLTIEELKQFCEIDSVKLGAWKHESNFTKARFIRQKCYIEEIDNKLNITCAGMPTSCYDNVNWETFKKGYKFPGKLNVKHVKGGVKLIEGEYTIKEDKIIKNINKM